MISRPRYPERRGADCYDWLPAEAVLRHALAAYYTVCRRMDALPDDPAQADATFNNGRRQLAEDLGELFTMRLLDAGFRNHIPGFDLGAGLWIAQVYGPRSPDDPPRAALPPPVSARPGLASGLRPDIHRAQLMRHPRGVTHL